MRTTIELTENRRTALVKLAADRGEKGFSNLIGQAVDEFLCRHAESERLDRDRRVTAALEAITPEFGEHLYKTLREVRSQWPA